MGRGPCGQARDPGIMAVGSCPFAPGKGAKPETAEGRAQHEHRSLETAGSAMGEKRTRRPEGRVNPEAGIE